MKRVNQLAIGILLLGQAISFGTQAAPVTLVGNTVDFTFDSSLLGQFGSPGVSGNTLFFTPVAFEAQAFNGLAFDLAKETMNIKVTAHSGHGLNTLNLLERGDYLLFGAASSVDVTGQIRAFDLANPNVDLTASISTLAPVTTVGLPTHNWTASAALNLASLDAVAANVTVQNLLIAKSFSADSFAFIEKKYVGLSVGTLAITPVPEAQTYAMMLAGLGLVAGSVMRRRTMQTRAESIIES